MTGLSDSHVPVLTICTSLLSRVCFKECPFLEDISGGKLGTDDWHRVTKGKIRIFVFSFLAGLTVCGHSSLFFFFSERK